jgi:Cytochrome c554 and c-prime
MERVAMTPESSIVSRRVFAMILGGIVTTAIVAACVGLYVASSIETADRSVTRTVAPPSKAMLPQDAAIVNQLVGGGACRECHPSESAVHSLSGHARTLRPAPVQAIATWLNGRSVKDREYPDAVWTYSMTDAGKLEVERTEHGQSACYPIKYALGSGANGVTFVSVRYEPEDPTQFTGMEQRLTYYARGPRMDITPGQAAADAAAQGIKVVPHGRPLNKDELVICLNCHSTVTSKKGSGQFDPDTMVPNISCERCHGPGRGHVEAARRGESEENLAMPLGSSVSATPLRQLQVCGECHRRLEDMGPRIALKPENSEIVRFQPVGLGLSACFQKGKSGLSCTSCHDPHARVSRDHAAYEAVCLNCHSLVQSRRQSCPISPGGQCIDCHMPRRTVSLEFLFTDHWIRKPDPKTDETKDRNSHK